MTSADQVVTGWPRLSAADREEIREFAILTPHPAMAELSWRGVDRFFDTVFDALAAADALGIPRDRVRVQPFPAPGPAVTASSPSQRVP